MAAALASGRQRQLLAEAQAVAAELKALPPKAEDQGQTAEVMGKLAELARLVKRLQTVTSSLEDPTARTMWEQRGMWMHQELMELTAERMQAGDPGLFWNNVAAVMYAGAEGHEMAIREKADVEERLRQAEQRLADSSHKVTELQEQIASHECSTVPHAHSITAEEVLELRTKLMVAQQELQRRVADSKDMHHSEQAWSSQRESMTERVRKLEEENTRLAESEEQGEAVIYTLMQESEAVKKRLEEKRLKCEEMEYHNHILSVNLENHARIVEKLIELNTELMDSANNRAFGHTLPTAAGISSGCSVNGEAHSARQANGGVDAVLVTVEPSEGVNSWTEKAGNMRSLGSALESFLTDDFEPPKQANACSLEITSGDPGAAKGTPDKSTGSNRSRFMGLTGALSAAASYVSGTDRIEDGDRLAAD